jgi:hypothetical protein
VRGIKIPGGPEYGPIFTNPRAAEHRIPEGEAVVDLDVALKLLMDSGEALTIFTDGVGYFVHLSLDRYVRARWQAYAVERRVF